MAKFVELTDDNGNPVIVNIEKIDSISILGVNSTRVIVNREKISVQEGFWEVVNKLPYSTTEWIILLLV
jgi:uncharacterized protein YlzI (FlbEa/FlbD family)